MGSDEAYVNYHWNLWSWGQRYSNLRNRTHSRSLISWKYAYRHKVLYLEDRCASDWALMVSRATVSFKFEVAYFETLLMMVLYLLVPRTNPVSKCYSQRLFSYFLSFQSDFIGAVPLCLMAQFSWLLQLSLQFLS